MPIKLEWSSKLIARPWEVELILEKVNKKIKHESYKWRLPTKEEVIDAIKTGRVNGCSFGSNSDRWLLTGSKTIEERLINNGSRKFEVYYVVRYDGFIDTNENCYYGLYLVR